MFTLDKNDARHRYGWTRLISGCALLFIYIYTSAFAQSQLPDQSDHGTQVMAAKTETEAIIAVDSRIVVGTGNPLHPTEGLSQGERKMIDVGSRSACALSAYFGTTGRFLTPDVDVAVYIRESLKKHPDDEAPEAMSAILNAIAEAWSVDLRQRGPGRGLPSGRKIGALITDVTCGTFRDGHPVIVRGHLEVGDDLLAVVKNDKAICGDRLYLNGVVDLRNFTGIMVDRRAVVDPDLATLRAEIVGDPEALRAFRYWGDYNCVLFPSSNTAAISLPKEWDEVQVRSLFKGIYRAIETASPYVAAPNQVRILTACGRFTRTVEDPWPTCPPGNAATEKKPKPNLK